MPPKNKKHHENHDRWLVSYADFVTLLFAFFVVMFATSHVDAGRMQQISEFYSAFLAKDGELVQQLLAKMAEKNKPEKPEADSRDARRVLTMAELIPIKDQVQQRLAPLLEADKIALSLTPRGLIISLRESGFFPPGQATFLPGTADLLTEVGAVIAELPNQPVRMEGHTDNTPIRTPVFPSNWELSTARAIAVLDLMVGRFDIDPRRLSVGGYAERRPIADNGTPEGRAKNRRVDIAILSQSAAELAPKQRVDSLEAPLLPQPAGPENAAPRTVPPAPAGAF
jgi:chemotaxis protein MotB